MKKHNLVSNENIMVINLKSQRMFEVEINKKRTINLQIYERHSQEFIPRNLFQIISMRLRKKDQCVMEIEMEKL
jgi:hypothetical protein